MTYRAERSGRALKQMHGLPGPAFNHLIEAMEEVIDYPDDPLRTLPTSDPYVRRVESGDAGLITYLATVRQSPAPRNRRVTTEPEQRYQIWFQPAARRAIPQRFPWQLPAGIGEQIGLSIGYAVCPASSGRRRPSRPDLC